MLLSIGYSKRGIDEGQYKEQYKNDREHEAIYDQTPAAPRPARSPARF